jgi:hypothetical protein
MPKMPCVYEIFMQPSKKKRAEAKKLWISMLEEELKNQHKDSKLRPSNARTDN